MAASFSDRRLRKVRERQPRAAARIQELFRDFDLLLTPSTARMPVEVGHWRGQGVLRTINGMSNVYPYGAAWNYTGQPAAAIPAGFTEGGLPRSVMIVAPPERRADPDLARRPARGGAALGGPPAEPALAGEPPVSRGRPRAPSQAR